MRVIIAGSREFNSPEVVDQVWRYSGFYIHELVCGGARGVDQLAAKMAEGRIPIKYFLPDWEKYGKAAGPIRNRQMAEYADALIAIWDGKSKGTQNMIHEMEKLGKPTFVYKYGEK